MGIVGTADVYKSSMGQYPNNLMLLVSYCMFVRLWSMHYMWVVGRSAASIVGPATDNYSTYYVMYAQHPTRANPGPRSVLFWIVSFRANRVIGYG